MNYTVLPHVVLVRTSYYMIKYHNVHFMKEETEAEKSKIMQLVGC